MLLPHSPCTLHACVSQVRELIYREILEYHPQVRWGPASGRRRLKSRGECGSHLPTTGPACRWCPCHALPCPTLPALSHVSTPSLPPPLPCPTPQMLADFLAGGHRQPNFVYPSAVDNFKRQFAHLEAGGRGQANPNLGQVRVLCVARLPWAPHVPATTRRPAPVHTPAPLLTPRRLPKVAGLPRERAKQVPLSPPFLPAFANLCVLLPAPWPLRLQATSLPRERVSEFRSEAAKYLAAQRGGTQHMSGVAGASAYHAMVPPGMSGASPSCRVLRRRRCCCRRRSAALLLDAANPAARLFPDRAPTHPPPLRVLSGPGGAGPPAYPYGSSVDMEGAVELVRRARADRCRGCKGARSQQPVGPSHAIASSLPARLVLPLRAARLP